MFWIRERFLAVALTGACTVAATGSISARLHTATLGSAALLAQYETRAKHDPDGTGKFYMGREIAQVMGPGGIEWLDRDQRETEEHPAHVLSALGLHRGDIVADLGAGSGYFTFRMAPMVGDTGKVLAVDVQDEIAASPQAAWRSDEGEELAGDQGHRDRPAPPAECCRSRIAGGCLHELAYPREVMEKVRDSLKPRGRVVFVEYRKEDPEVPIKEVHKMSVQQLEKEMAAVGLVRKRMIETLPIQHIVVFEKSEPSPSSSS